MTDESPFSGAGDPPIRAAVNAAKDFLLSFRYAVRRFRPMIGASAIVVVLMGFGVFSHLNEREVFRSRAGSSGAASAANERNEINPAHSAAPALSEKTTAVESRPTFPAPQVQAVDVAHQDVSPAPLEKAVPATVAKLQETSTITAGVPDAQKVNGAGRVDAETNSNKGIDFLVVGPSFVRAKPTANADIIATLKPGTHISVAGRTGEYFRIRTLGTETIRGYVHKEDAFFKRKS